jgi:hypothetical protein
MMGGISMKNSNKRKALRRIVNLLLDADLDAALWLLQGYAARAMNQQYREDQMSSADNSAAV